MLNPNPGTIYIISAPSGAGKTTLTRALTQEMPNIHKSVSYTTRAIRPGEENGVDYNFVTLEEFKRMSDQKVFLEVAQVFGNSYGTSFPWVEGERNLGKDIILEIDWQGARQIRSRYFDAVSIFILPPSEEELLARLIKRHQDNPDIIAERMKQAKNEMSKYIEYDYIVLNDKFEEALVDLKSIVRSKRLGILHQKKELSERIQGLLR